jgi:hypothetical protein
VKGCKGDPLSCRPLLAAVSAASWAGLRRSAAADAAACEGDRLGMVQAAVRVAELVAPALKGPAAKRQRIQQVSGWSLFLLRHAAIQ